MIHHTSEVIPGASGQEYVLPLPLENVKKLYLRGLTDLAENDVLSQETINRVWAERSNLEFELSRELYSEIDQLKPFSLVVVGIEWWICFQETTSHENRGRFFLVPFLPPIEIENFPISKHPELWEFLNVFRTVSCHVPPLVSSWGQKFDGKPAIVTHEAKCWGHFAPEWEHALVSPLPISDLSGDILLFNEKGEFGMWSAGNLYSSRPMISLVSKREILQKILDGLCM